MCRRANDGTVTGCLISDYTVTLGNQPVPIVNVLSNRLIFQPPQSKPDDVGLYPRDGHPSVEASLDSLPAFYAKILINGQISDIY